MILKNKYEENINSSSTFPIPDFFFFSLKCEISVRQGCDYKKKQTKAELTIAILKCKCYSLNFQVRVFEFSALHNILS